MESGGEWIVNESGSRIIGESPAFKKTLEKTARLASYDGVSVLLRGETGSGKGIVARLLHEKSRRRNNPFLPINCSAVAASIAESEFFGHVRGAFTGAERERIGQFRAADGGTVFLDEIGDLPLDIQPKLLRVLEDRTLIPVGSDKEIKVDVRVIAATNRDLEGLIQEGLFRRDLYERIANVTISVPPLRERPEDVPLLVHEFLLEWNRRYGEEKSLSPDTMEYLRTYSWPGNIRELHNVVLGLCSTGLGPVIGPEFLPGSLIAHDGADAVCGDIPVSVPESGMNLRALLYRV